MQKNGLTGPELLQKKPKLDYPDSVLGFFRGEIGVPLGGFNEELKAMVLGSSPVGDKDPPPVLEEQDDLRTVQHELASKIQAEVSEQMAMSYRLYPKVFLDFWQHRLTYGTLHNFRRLTFFMAQTRRGNDL